ncbi:hypothetical protein BpHYR1_032772 [Brachionus plicatilis]|uniref:Uncharacterized protein n=1 Tax=Brachionus plicatilis TaxID=10195 RepID=A0A3M7QXC5_BRAPC|nr:hypothetical protein BpHYR1_032772 [Brachionus plicatilis]
MAPKLKNKNREKQIESKKKKRNVESDDESSDYEEKVIKKAKADDDLEMIAITYEIQNEKHPFFFLNQVPGSVELKKIIEPLEKNETGKLNRDNKSNNDFIERSFSSINENLFKLNASLLKIHEEQRDLKDLREIINNPSERTQHSSENNVMISNPSMESGSNIGIVSNKEFTNFLRSELERKFKDDPNKTLGYYQTNYPNRILEIKNDLVKFVPQHLSFREAWERASNSIKMDKSKK